MSLRRYHTLVYDSVRWEGFQFRADDIVISTPPKCGTTWTQMICALLIFQTPAFYTSLDLISPWLDMLTRDLPSVVADLDAQDHRRFIKTHTPFDGLPHDPRVTYICVGRDPRDVFRSWDNHIDNMDLAALLAAREKAVGLDDVTDLLAAGPPPRPEQEIDRFREWVNDERPFTEAMSLAATLHHLQTFWDRQAAPNIVMVHYDDLRTDLGGQMRGLARRLGIEVDEVRWPELVDAAMFENMRKHADRIAPDTTNAIWTDNQRFFHRGCSGQWQDLLGPDDLASYERRVAALAPPDLAAWAEHGASARRTS
ncbi:MAG TPA: sulfotransferase domain-containing protein [Acidimicrobiia bacterium]|nr:sulfotransferase domain-containing protein [Acidimicrobiia bacterium]